MSSKSLTIVQILPALEGGGVERGTLEVAAELVRRGHRSIVISAPGRLVEPLVRAGSEHVAWPVGVKSPTTLRLLPRLRRLLLREDVDVLHARSRVPAWLAYLTWKTLPSRSRTRFLTTVHAMHSVSAYSAIMHRGERVIAVSNTARQHVLEHYRGVDPQRIEVIHRGVDPAEFPYGHHPDERWLAAWYEEFPHLREAGPVLTLPGRMTRRKGHRDFVKLIARLRDRGVAAHGLIVGGEDPKRRQYAQQVRQDVAELGLDDRITFTGNRDDIREIYAISDVVYCLSKPAESFGRTVVEALSIGTPVIGYDLGGVGETLAELLPAGRVAVDDLDELTERTLAVLANRPEVLPNTVFTRQAMLDRTLAVYREMAAHT